MGEILDFEGIAAQYERTLNVRSLSHCDFLKIAEEEILFVEETDIGGILDPNSFKDLELEMIKKMWGSLVIFTWYCAQNSKWHLYVKRRKFLIKISKLDGRSGRAFKNMISALLRYKDGAYDDILCTRFKIR